MTLHPGKLAMMVCVSLVMAASLATAQDDDAGADVPAEPLACLAELASPATDASNPADLLQQAVDLAYDLLDAYPDAQNLTPVRQHLLAAARSLLVISPGELNRQQLISACEDVLAAGQSPTERLTADSILTEMAVSHPDATDQDRQAKLRILARKYAGSEAEADALIAAAALAGRLKMTVLFNEFVDQLAADHVDSGLVARFLVRVGRPVPFRAELTTLDGTSLSLPDDLFGKVVLVAFWESDCLQSQNCEPHLRKLYQTYREKGLEIVGISLDGPDQAASLRAHIAENGLTWIQTYSGQGVADPTFVHYGLDEKPAFWLIGAGGNILTDDALVAVGDASRTASLDNLEIYVRWALKLPATTDTAP